MSFGLLTNAEQCGLSDCDLGEIVQGGGLPAILRQLLQIRGSFIDRVLDMA